MSSESDTVTESSTPEMGVKGAETAVTLVTEPLSSAAETDAEWKAKYEAQLKINRKLEQRAKDNLTEAEKATQRAKSTEDRLAEVEQELKDGRLERLRIAVAKRTKGLTLDDADLIHGDTEEEMNEFAKRLAARVKPPTPDLGQGIRGNPAAKTGGYEAGREAAANRTRTKENNAYENREYRKR